jgi:hypothetical protein
MQDGYGKQIQAVNGDLPNVVRCYAAASSLSRSGWKNFSRHRSSAQRHEKKASALSSMLSCISRSPGALGSSNAVCGTNRATPLRDES